MMSWGSSSGVRALSVDFTHGSNLAAAAAGWEALVVSPLRVGGRRRGEREGVLCRHASGRAVRE
jgi:hypothetical protein